VAFVDDGEEFLAAPRGTPAPNFEESPDDLGGGFMGRVPRSSRAFLETRGAEAKIAVDPFVGGLARDAVELAELRDG
jgi:hypothetical protein